MAEKKTTSKIVFWSFFIIIAAIVMIVVITVNDGKSSSTSTSRSTSTTSSPSVLPASAEQIESVTMGLEKGFKLQNVYAQKIKTNEYAVAARMIGPGVDDVAIWFVRHTASGSVGNVYSHEAVTAEFSEWPLHREFIPASIATNVQKYVRSKQ